MKLYLVIADDTYYDAGEQWIVGIFESEALADVAIANDQQAYSMEQDTGKHLHCGTLCHVVTKLELNQPTQELLYLNNAC